MIYHEIEPPDYWLSPFSVVVTDRNMAQNFWRGQFFTGPRQRWGQPPFGQMPNQAMFGDGRMGASFIPPYMSGIGQVPNSGYQGLGKRQPKKKGKAGSPAKKTKTDTSGTPAKVSKAETPATTAKTDTVNSKAGNWCMIYMSG